MSKLTGRLGLLAEMITPGHTVADVGADHARLALYLVEEGVSPWVIVSELGEGPWARARQALLQSHDRKNIELRQGDGLQVLCAGEVQEVVLAGMGGDTMVDILGHDWDKAATFQRFLFQPMTRVEVLRRHLSEQGWGIEDERLVQEEQRLYIVIAARPGLGFKPLNELELEVGPIILKTDDDLKKEYIKRRLHKLRTIYHDMLASPKPDIQAAAQLYNQRVLRLEEILNASPRASHN